MQVTVEVPDEVAEQLGRKAEMPRRILEALALEGYRGGRLSRGQVSELLGLSFCDTEMFLKDNNAPLVYSLADLAADRAALNDLLGSK
jgi:predicted HTH domain antitoxin